MARNILAEIVEAKRKELEQARADCPIERLGQEVLSAPPVRNFFQACVQRPRRLVNVIAEVKRASPSAGVIRSEVDPAAVARRYQAVGAVAVSVLTDRTYFGGSLDDLRQVRAAVELPVLRKDFIIDAYQVYQSRAAGADAILLIAECLTPGAMMDLVILAQSLRLTCLIEVHGMEQMMRMRSVIGFPHASYSLLGINNRDLTSFQVDVATTLRLAELAQDPRTLVSESGIKARRDVERLAAAGVNTVLVGEALMRSDDVAATMDELFGEPR